MKSLFLLLLAAVFIWPSAARAEYREIDLTIFGMDCAICAHGVSVALKNLQGVESVSLSTNEGLARITLKPGNTLRLERIYKLVNEQGFTPKEARVKSVGTIVLSNTPQFRVAGTGETYELKETPPADWRKQAGKLLLVNAVVPEPANGKPPASMKIVNLTNAEQTSDRSKL